MSSAGNLTEHLTVPKDSSYVGCGWYLSTIPREEIETTIGIGKLPHFL